MLPPLARPDRAADSIPLKHLHSSLNKQKFPINVVSWTPEGRRLLTASSSGEFTLWNGMGFNFETIMQVSISPLTYEQLLKSNRHTTPQLGQLHGHTTTNGSSPQIRMAGSSTGKQTSTTSRFSKGTTSLSVVLHSLLRIQSL